MNYPNRINVARAHLQLSEKEFAARYNVSVKDLRKWEAEKDAPPIELVAELASILRVHIEFILGHDYDPKVEYNDWEQDEKEDYDAAQGSEWHDVCDLLTYRYGKGEFTSAPEYIPTYLYGLLQGDKSNSPALVPIINEYVERLNKKYIK